MLVMQYLKVLRISILVAHIFLIHRLPLAPFKMIGSSGAASNWIKHDSVA